MSGTRRRSRWSSTILCLASAVLLSGCGAAGVVRTAPPADSWQRATAVAAKEVRVYADFENGLSDLAEASATRAVMQRADAAREAGRPFDYTILALSGGGEDGAFGAGLLTGWTERSDRPTFDVVTGVSTGALIAPFAFAGPEYEPALERFYTETRTDDIIVLQLFSALFGALSIGDSSPLKAAIDREVTPALLAAIAQGHREGRRLLIGTTNLDARRGVIWDMGAIAARGGPEAAELFRQVILASASIPGAFEPVYIDVEIDGQRYKELHVDGGVTNTVFVAPSWFRFDPITAGLTRNSGRVYVIQNNKIEPAYGPTQDRLVSIVGDSVSALIRNQGRGDQLRIFQVAQRAGFDYRVAFVPADFDAPRDELFDPAYMRALFEVGREVGLKGEAAWRDEPPGLPRVLRRRKQVAEAVR